MLTSRLCQQFTFHDWSENTRCFAPNRGHLSFTCMHIFSATDIIRSENGLLRGCPCAGTTVQWQAPSQLRTLQCILEVSGSAQDKVGPGSASLASGSLAREAINQARSIEALSGPTFSWPDPLTPRMHFPAFLHAYPCLQLTLPFLFSPSLLYSLPTSCTYSLPSSILYSLPLSCTLSISPLLPPSCALSLPPVPRHSLPPVLSPSLPVRLFSLRPPVLTFSSLLLFASRRFVTVPKQIVYALVLGQGIERDNIDGSAQCAGLCRCCRCES